MDIQTPSSGDRLGIGDPMHEEPLSRVQVDPIVQQIVEIVEQ